jgi:ribonuclease HII
MTARNNTPSLHPPPSKRGRDGGGVRPHLDYERQFLQAGRARVAGIDEAGRGAWAGPVVAAAVILETPCADRLAGVNDSKQLSPRQRERLYQVIVENCRAFGVGHGTAAEIDSFGIVSATRLAMTRAIAALSPPPDALIIDAVRLPTVPLPQSVFCFADSISLSVAAASIIAKVTRDRLMVDLDAQYPRYGFARHKGYGTRIHQVALQSIGPCEIHRQTFKPISALAADWLI